MANVHLDPGHMAKVKKSIDSATTTEEAILAAARQTAQNLKDIVDESIAMLEKNVKDLIKS